MSLSPKTVKLISINVRTRTPSHFSAIPPFSSSMIRSSKLLHNLSQNLTRSLIGKHVWSFVTFVIYNEQYNLGSLGFDLRPRDIVVDYYTDDCIILIFERCAMISLRPCLGHTILFLSCNNHFHGVQIACPRPNVTMQGYNMLRQVRRQFAGSH